MANSFSTAKTPPPPPRLRRDEVLVCGLGSLGQHCVANLKTFGVRVNAIEFKSPDRWEIDDLDHQIDNLLIGDCRQTAILEKANVRQCRAALLVTNNERVNLEAALSARVLNPHIRLVVRSEQQNLNDLLESELTNFVAFEPTQLAAPAFALEALDEAMIGFFKLDDLSFRIIKRTVQEKDPWCDNRRLHELQTRDRRILNYVPANAPDAPQPMAPSVSSPSTQFYTWLPDTIMRRGDIIVTVESETADALLPSGQFRTAEAQSERTSWWQALANWRTWRPKDALTQFLQSSAKNQIRQVALLCGITVVLLCLLGIILLVATGTTPTVADAFYATVVLLLGGYGDIFGGLALSDPVVWWLRLFSLTLSLAGTAFIGVIYALLTEKLLSLRFEFLAKRPPIPEKGHIVVIWLGRVGRRVAEILLDLKQPVVGITSQAIEPDVLPQLPIISGPIADGLEKANLATAKSVVALSDDEIQNLELGLMAYRTNPDSRLIIRTYDQLFTDKVAHLFPYAQVLCASAISAEAFVGSAFGENVIGLFRLYNQTVLITQYEVEADDTLNGLLVGEVAYGYGVVPLWHYHKGGTVGTMPSDDEELDPGDLLVILSTIRGLRRIEQGDLAPKQWQIEILKANAADALFEGGTEISRVTGCSLNEAHQIMTQLPAVFPHRLYLHQALRLVRRLGRLRVSAQLIPLEDRVGQSS
jgi:Trk K+ transport system NAD-binding subunit